MPDDVWSSLPVPPKPDVEKEMVAGSKKERTKTRKLRARLRRKNLKRNEKMKAHAGSKEEEPKYRPEFHDESMFSAVETTPKEEEGPSGVGKRKKKLKYPKEEGLSSVVGKLKYPKFKEPMYSVVKTIIKEDPSGSGKRKKELVLRLSEEFLQYIANKPCRPPYQRRPIRDFELKQIQENVIAEEEEGRASRDNVLKQYKDRGYAEMLLEVTDNEEE